MSNRTLTDRFIQSCKPAPAGKRIDYADSVVPGLVLRVTDRGHKSFALRCRYPSHPDNPTRRALGDYGALSLDDARQKARRWMELIGKGIDPKIEEARQKAEAQRRQIKTSPPLPPTTWNATRPSSPGAGNRAHHQFGIREALGRPAGDRGHARRGRGRDLRDRSAWCALSGQERLCPAAGMYRWAIGTGEYGIQASPTERLQPSKLIGKLELRDRVLKDDELHRVWAPPARWATPMARCSGC